jgi:hydroxyacylglutathione hydrolase
VPVDGGSFGTKAAFVLLHDEPFVLHARTREEALDATRKLWAVGLLDVSGYVLHAAAEKRLATLSAHELQALLDQVQIVDVREPTERDSGYIPGSRNIPYRLLRKVGCDSIERDKPVVTICESGARAMIAASVLAREGFDVRPVVNGGIPDFTGEMVDFRRCGGV